MSLIEKLGLIGGYILGCFFFILSYLRSARCLHPTGLLYEANIESNFLHAHAIVRLSSGWWKNKEWPDVLGIAIRFIQVPALGVIKLESHQDLLFITSPLKTNHHNFLSNYYFAVLPFSHEGKRKNFKLIPQTQAHLQGTREEKLLEAVLEGSAVLTLQQRTLDQNNWETLAIIKLIRPLHYDQESLRFDPFLNGLKIIPSGFFQYLRRGSYKLSQWARPKQTTLP